MASSRKSNYTRKRTSDPLERRMDQWIETGRQFVDGVAGNRPGQRRQSSLGINRTDFDNVGRWVGDKLDWFFEEDDDWSNVSETQENSQLPFSSSKRPLKAISLRVPKALPPQIQGRRSNSGELDEWPDDQSFKLNRWERKNNLIKQNEQSLQDSFQDERPTRRRNIPRSNRRKT